MLDLYAELLEVSGALSNAGIAAALVGGLAYSIYVEPRATEDIDFLIFPEDWERCVAALKPYGWLNVAEPMNFKGIQIRRLTKIVPKSSLVCDFLLADESHRDGVANRNRVVVDGRPLDLARPDVIIALKRCRMSEKDRGDIEGLERLLRGQSDRHIPG